MLGALLLAHLHWTLFKVGEHGEQLSLNILIDDCRTSAWAVIWYEDSTVLDPMRPHLLQSPHAYTVRTSQNDIVAVALLKFILNKGPNRLWYRW